MSSEHETLTEAWMKSRTSTKILCAFLAAAVCAGPAAAQDLLGSYYAEVGPEDRRNSGGNALTDAGAILQQDRANVHRFSIRHPGDQVDRVFLAPDQRALVPDLFRNGQTDGSVVALISGPPSASVQLLILLCGRDERLSHLAVGLAVSDVPLTCRLN